MSTKTTTPPLSDEDLALQQKLANTISPVKVAQAVAALHHKLNSKTSTKAALVDSDESYELQINLKNPQNEQQKQRIISIPHSIYKRPGVSICLFVPNPQSEWEKYLEENQVSNVTRVLSIKSLTTDFKPFEHRRMLAKQHDMFIADKSIIPMLPKLLGRNFFTSAKRPIGVQLSRGFKNELKKARDSTTLIVPPGSVVTVKIGHSSQTAQQVVENIMAALLPIVSNIPNKLANITSIYVKTTNSPSLPIFYRVAAATDYTMNLEQQRDALKKAAEAKQDKSEATAAKYGLTVEKYKLLKSQAKKANLAFPKFFKAYQQRCEIKAQSVKAHNASLAMTDDAAVVDGKKKAAAPPAPATKRKNPPAAAPGDTEAPIEKVTKQRKANTKA